MISTLTCSIIKSGFHSVHFPSVYFEMGYSWLFNMMGISRTWPFNKILSLSFVSSNPSEESKDKTPKLSPAKPVAWKLKTSL